MVGTVTRRQRLLFPGVTLILAAALTLVAGEALVRIAVPIEAFWPISNIYSPSVVPGVVYTYRPGFRGTAFGVDLKTNGLGFRGPDWPTHGTPGTFRVALVGDSHAFGFGVPYESTVGEVLASLLQKRFGVSAEVLNFGVNGFNGRQQRAVVENLALKYSPDLVILLPVGNDHSAALRADAQGWLHWDGVPENQRSRIADKSIERLGVDSARGWMAKSRLWLYLKLVQKRQQCLRYLYHEYREP